MYRRGFLQGLMVTALAEGLLAGCSTGQGDIAPSDTNGDSLLLPKVGEITVVPNPTNTPISDEPTIEEFLAQENELNDETYIPDGIPEKFALYEKEAEGSLEAVNPDGFTVKYTKKDYHSTGIVHAEVDTKIYGDKGYIISKLDENSGIDTIFQTENASKGLPQTRKVLSIGLYSDAIDENEIGVAIDTAVKFIDLPANLQEQIIRFGIDKTVTEGAIEFLVNKGEKDEEKVVMNVYWLNTSVNCGPSELSDCSGENLFTLYGFDRTSGTSFPFLVSRPLKKQ